MSRDFQGIWIDRELWLNTDLSITERCFLAEITSLDGDDHCFASNGHFAEWSGLKKDSCSKIITRLKDKGLISVKIDRDENGLVTKRIISVIGKKALTKRQKNLVSPPKEPEKKETQEEPTTTEAPSDPEPIQQSRPFIAASKAHGTEPAEKYAEYEDAVRLWRKYDKTGVTVDERYQLSGSAVSVIETVAKKRITVDVLEHCLKCYNAEFEKRKNDEKPWAYGGIEAFFIKGINIYMNKKAPMASSKTEPTTTPKPRHRCFMGHENGTLKWQNGSWYCVKCGRSEPEWGPYERYETDVKPEEESVDFSAIKGIFGGPGKKEEKPEIPF